jgi:hypothetical protein
MLIGLGLPHEWQGPSQRLGGLVGEYAIRVSGRLSDALVSAFPTMRHQPLPVQTLLWGDLPDQAALQGVLDHLDELGVEILEVNQLPDRADQEAEHPA